MDTQPLRSQQDRRMTLEEMFESFDTLRFAVLATSEQGSPYTSLIAFALTPDRHTLIFATPKATRKYENIISQPAVSILVDNRSQEAGDIQGAQAVTLLGTAQEVSTPALANLSFQMRARLSSQISKRFLYDIRIPRYKLSLPKADLLKQPFKQVHCRAEIQPWNINPDSRNLTGEMK